MGESSFPSRRALFAPREWGGITAAGAIAERSSAYRERLTSDPFNDWRAGRGCNKLLPVLGVDGTKIAPTADIFVQPPAGMNWIWGKLAGHVEDHVFLSPEGAVMVTYPEPESSYPRLPQSLNNSSVELG